MKSLRDRCKEATENLPFACRERLEALHAEMLDRIDEAEENDKLREKMAGILTRTANALRGKPNRNVAWSWHDLPELAMALKAKVPNTPLFGLSVENLQ